MLVGNMIKMSIGNMVTKLMICIMIIVSASTLSFAECSCAESEIKERYRKAAEETERQMAMEAKEAIKRAHKGFMDEYCSGLSLRSRELDREVFLTERYREKLKERASEVREMIERECEEDSK